ncbi:hypothetical protein G7Y89_g11147 [Cudoniella acicularis]|uniref:Uncharacterized protein n=1 Tax=Cudoniella acicularis TaxID=354080 RepID=A0A8H4RE24_9HELO|nr:hypothetical protein G7Y89_g11147 [Cudoniella acicularis]
MIFRGERIAHSWGVDIQNIDAKYSNLGSQAESETGDNPSTLSHTQEPDKSVVEPALNDESEAEEEREDGVDSEEEASADVSQESYLQNDSDIPRFLHHQSCQAFLEAADGGCQLCLRVLNQLSEEDRLVLAHHDQAQEIDPINPHKPTTNAITGET